MFEDERGDNPKTLSEVWLFFPCFAPLIAGVNVLWLAGRTPACSVKMRLIHGNPRSFSPTACLVADIFELCVNGGFCGLVLYIKYGRTSLLGDCGIDTIAEEKWTLGQVFAVVTALSPLYCLLENVIGMS